jgi:hypothetical protein
MDLPREVNRLRLDLLAVSASSVLAGADVPHVLLKGPSVAHWLYDPPRSYNDVDLLVPLSRVDDASAALESAGVASARAGGVGEEAEHSLLLTTREGFEVDLHVALPTMRPDGDRLWSVLADHVESMSLGVGRVPVLDVPGRCVVVALHALNSSATIPQTADDLRRARAAATQEEWAEAAELADAIGVRDLFDAGIATGEPTPAGAASTRAYLFANSAPGPALGLARLGELPWWKRPGAVAREAFPSRGFMRRAYPQLTGESFGLIRAYLVRLRLLAAQLPESVRMVRHARAGRIRGDDQGR